MIAALAVVLALAGAAARAAEAPALPPVAVAELPPEAQRTVRAILDGGPFRYDRDGAVFGNFERLLPRRDRGYYREYTVETPGLKHRGARRIVAGRKGELPIGGRAYVELVGYDRSHESVGVVDFLFGRWI